MEKKEFLDFEAFLSRLRNAFSQALPGFPAQSRMAPPHRSTELNKILPGEMVRDSAVLILLWQEGDQIFTVFILRTEYEGIHSNQISFPGGKHEPSDVDFVETALREAQEEVGIIPKTVTILSQLTPLYIPPSRFLVYPFVGFTNTRPHFMLDPLEVQEVIPCNILDFLRPDHFMIQDLEVRGRVLSDIPCFKIHDHLIWGATAMIFNELLETIKPIVRIFPENDER